MVDLEDVESINGVALSTFLTTVVPQMVSGKSQVLAAASLRAAFERTRELVGNTTGGVTSVEVVNKLAAFMFSGTVNVLSASSVLAGKEHLAGKSFSADLAYCQEATTIAFQALNILDDIYLNKLMPDFSDPEIFADHSMSKVHIRIKHENRTRLAERVYHVRGDSDSLRSSQKATGGSAHQLPEESGRHQGLLERPRCRQKPLETAFLESNFNPYEYSNNSHEIGADVTGLGVKCRNRTLPVSGLSEPIDILTRRSKNDSISELIYVFKASETLGNMAIFQFFVRKNRSALSLELDFNNTLYPPDVTMFLRKEAPPTAAEYDWRMSLPVPDEQMVYISWTNGTNLTSNPYHWLLSPEEVNITSEDVENMTNYFVGKCLSVQLGSEQDLGRGDIVNFTLYVFETSCVYFDEELHLWQTDGCEVGLISNTSHIHCRCYHLTKFSGFVAPNPLNIAEALSANVLENPSGLVLVLTVFGAYLMGIVWARKSDRRDVVKAGIGILPGHKLNPRQDCQYLITVYTGFKGNSGTTAEVTIVLCSQDHESPPFRLSDQKRILFERGSVDSFLVSTSQPLGALRYIRVCHNNGGYSPGWFLSQIVVTNRGDNTPNYFICNRWFALDRDDGNISRVLIEADPDEMKKFRNLFLAKSSRDMNDGHLWFSVAGRPARSPFSRVQRLSCCLTLLYSTMVTNIMFFGRGDDFDSPEPIRIGGIEIDPPISLPQIMIGLQSAAIIMPVNLIIVFLFRNSGSRCSVENEKTASRKNVSLKSLTKCLPQKKQNDKEASKKRNEPPSLWHRKEKDTVQKRQSHDYAENYLCKRPIQLSFVESMTDIVADNEANPEDVETEQNSSLPWWSVYIGWLLVWTASFLAAFFTVLYSLSFGRAKAEAWLFTFLTSFLTDLFLIQPFKLMLVAVLFALLAKKPVEDEDPVPAPLHQDEEYLEENTNSQVVRNGTRLWRTATGWSRYLWTEESKTSDQLNERTPELVHSNSPPDEADLAKQRALSLERSKSRKQVLEVLLFGLFVTVIMVTSYGERSPLAFYVTENVQRLLSESGDIGFSEIKDIPSFWTWVTTGLIPATHAAQWYNGRHSKEAAILEDMLTHPMGPVQLRQVRLTPGFPYFGKQGTYLSGGYVTSLGSTQQRSLDRAAYLQKHAWLDDKTRAVFIELTLYNPHVNLFSLVSMATEFTGLGTVYKGSEVVTLRLIQHDAILLLVLRGCLAIFILFFVIREGKALFSRPFEYLTEFWSWVELLLIAVGFSALGVYFHTQSIIDDVAIQRAVGNASFGAYKSAVGWFQVYTNLLGLLICCATLKFVRILRFNSHVYALSMTMRRSLKPVTQFMFTVGILIMAFTQMANLIFGVKLAGYKNITSSLQSLLFMMLGSFDFEELEQGHSLLGPLMFFTYQCMMQFFLLSMFMAIIMDVYAEETQSTNSDELNFNAFVKESAIRTMKKVQNRKTYNVDVKKSISRHVYDHLQTMFMTTDTNSSAAVVHDGNPSTSQNNVSNSVTASEARCARPVTNFVFIKVHKTASGSTFMLLARFGRNHGMTICYPVDHERENHVALSYPRTVAGWYSIVLITEYWEESLVLLRRKFCWTMYDILHSTKKLHHLNSVKQLKEHAPLTDKQKDTHRKMSNIDYMMYDYFNNTFWQLVASEGPDYWEEVAYYKTLNHEVNEHCDSTNRARVFPAGKWSQEFMIDSTFCNELQYWEEEKWARACRNVVRKQNEAFVKKNQSQVVG
ncbi:hypothetical protein Bbelb_129740 [Branchiostoma belcheri]|nr:hypothetical protein Bbelb_129740 [Branchiostoma belcheri]